MRKARGVRRARKRLKQEASGPRPAVRGKVPGFDALQRAFLAWTEDRRPRHLSVFLTALRRPQPDLRYAAMYALSAGEHSARPLLVKALKADATLWPALRLLRDLGAAETRNQVAALLDHPDYAIRALAFRTLLKIDGETPPEERWRHEIVARERVPSLTTIIHGTWAEDETWWRWPSEFPSYLDSVARDFYKGADAFQWEGDNTLEAREKGARSLITWLKTHPADHVRLIAHSHGGNVVFKATELAEHGEIRIDQLILLGTPIRNDYIPRLQAMGRLVNVFSKDDSVQWMGTWTPDLQKHARGDGRRLPDEPGVTNREVTTRTDDPHSELHTSTLWKREGLDRLLSEG